MLQQRFIDFYSYFYFFSNFYFYFYFITKNQDKNLTWNQTKLKALPSVKLSKKDSDDNSNGNVNNQHFLPTWNVLNGKLKPKIEDDILGVPVYQGSEFTVEHYVSFYNGKLRIGCPLLLLKSC